MKNKILTLAASVFVVTVILTSCNTPEQKVQNAENNVTQASNNLDTANQEYVTEFQNYKQKTEDQITLNDKRISELKTKTKKLKGDAKDDYDKKIAELEQENNDLNKKLSDYKPEGKEKWEIFKADFNKSMDQLDQSINNLFSNNK